MNVLLLTSDQHNKFVGGEVANGVSITPNLDRLAVDGTSFDSAWTNNPICMPARATLATGLFGHTVESYDNGSAYDGRKPSWGHRVTAGGFTANTFGKLHFMPDSDVGFDMHLPLQAKPGYAGALMGWARGEFPIARALRKNVEAARVGEFEYTTYDRHTTASAVGWLASSAAASGPWAAHVSWTYPHYPYRVPAEYVADFAPEDIALPVQSAPDAWPGGVENEHRRKAQAFDTPVDEDTLRRMRWIYHGMVRFLDEQVGLVLDALERAGLAEDTLVIYTSDHGDMLGEKGMFMKGVMYESSVGIPMIVRGPRVDEGERSSVPVSLADIAPTVLDALGLPEQAELPGASITSLSEQDKDRLVFSEYHGPTSTAAYFAVRRGDVKYVEYTAEGAEPELFDLAVDPHEEQNLAAMPEHAERVAALAGDLRTIVDPAELDAEIRDWQQRKLAEAGGLPAKFAPPGGTTGLGAYTVPPADIMATVGTPNDVDWAD